MAGTLRKKIENLASKILFNPAKRFFSLIEKECRVLINDKGAMLITFFIPIISIIILAAMVPGELLSSEGSGTSLGGVLGKEAPKVGIIDYDNSEGFPNRDLSCDFVAEFQEREENGECYLFISTNQSELEEMLGRGELNAFIVIPSLFEFNLSIHLPVILPMVLDTIDSINLMSSQEFIEGVIYEFKVENDFMGVFQLSKNQLNIPEKNQTYFAAFPLLIPMLIFGIGMLTSCQAIISDIPKDRMVLTPTNKQEIMAAKVVANIIIQLGVGLIILISSALMKLEIRSSYFEFAIALFILIVNAVLTGVAISALAKSSLAAFQYFIFVFIFNIMIMWFVKDPRILALIPLNNGSEILLQIVLRGQSLWTCIDQIINLAVESIVLYVFAFLVFKHQRTML